MTESNVTLCNRSLGTKASPEMYGRCIKNVGHAGGCSSPELKRFRREATAKSRSKAKRLKETPTEVDDSAPDDTDDLCACGHSIDSCPNPKYCGLSRTQIEERQNREAEEAAAEAQRVAVAIRKAEQERYLADILNRVDAGETISHEDQALFLATVISYLGLPAKFSLDRETRIRRELDVESRLSEVLYGPAYTRLGDPPSRLDEKSFKVRLGRLLNVADQHGWLNVAHRQHPSHKAPTTPSTPVNPVIPPVFAPGPPPGL